MGAPCPPNRCANAAHALGGDRAPTLLLTAECAPPGVQRDYCRLYGTREILGEALPQNNRIIGLVKKLGFTVEPTGEEGVRKFKLSLR